MAVEQLSVFLENEAGRLAELADALVEGGVSIRGLSVAEDADFGIARLVVDRTDRAQELLRGAGFTVTRSPVVAVQIPDRPGGLAAVLRALRGKKLNIEYLYALAPSRGEQVVFLFRFEQTDEAEAILREAGLKVLADAEVHAL
jgi:hypothetical protein